MKEQMKERVAYIEEVIKQYLPKEEGFQKTVLEAMNYSLLAGGKRIRPMLLLETYRLFGGKKESEIEPFLAAIEMIHTYSLVHDDLPAMDNDEYRRGRKTTHVMYGEAMGILAGDGLLNYAFEIASKCFDSEENLPRKAKAMQVLASKPGIYGMIGGQAVDVECENMPVDYEKLCFIYKLKTSALIEASMLIGAILAGATKTEQQIIEKIAEKIGFAFQIQDDILDVTSTVEVLGKPIRSDEKNHKTTYVVLKGVEEAKKEVEIISKEALDLLDGLLYKNEFLRQLIIVMIHREK